MMKATLLTLCLLAACAAALAAGAAAQDRKEKARPDLSGTWELDRSKSDFGLFRDRPVSKADSTLVIEHKEPELKIARTLKLGGQQETKQFAYYTDGRGETNPATIGAGEVKSKTKWDGEKVAAQSKLLWPGRDGSAGAELDVTQRWQISSDGKTLTNSTVMSSAQTGVQEMRLVYRRAAQ